MDLPGRSLPVVATAIGLAGLVTFLSAHPAPQGPVVNEISAVSDDAPMPAGVAPLGRVAGRKDHEPSLRVRVQMPTTLRAGGGRQIRVSVQEGRIRAWDHRRDPLLRLDLRVVQRGREGLGARVTPDAMVLRRSDLRWTHLDLYVPSQVGCDARLGHLLVRVAEIGEQGATGERSIELPPVECRAPPPAPDSVHDITPRCPDGLELQEWVLAAEDPPADQLCREPGAPSPRRWHPPADPEPGSPDEDPDPTPDDEREHDDRSGIDDTPEPADEAETQPIPDGSEGQQAPGAGVPDETPDGHHPPGEGSDASTGSGGPDGAPGGVDDAEITDGPSDDTAGRDGFSDVDTDGPSDDAADRDGPSDVGADTAGGSARG